MTATRLGSYQLEMATGFGPRITSLTWDDGSELLADLGPGVSLDHPAGTFRFRGGHRLWVAPEVPAVSYAPDDHECAVTFSQAGMDVTAPVDSAGWTKEMTVMADGEDLVIDHRLSTTTAATSVAPWAITQFPLGGTAIVPLVGYDTGPRPNRHLVLWPYTSLRDERISFLESAVTVRASDGPPLKLGCGTDSRRLGYLRDGLLFTKEADPVPEGELPDRSAALQLYVGQGFCELETVGALADLDAHGRLSHTERWRVQRCADIADACRLLTAVGA